MTNINYLPTILVIMVQKEVETVAGGSSIQICVLYNIMHFYINE